MRLNFTMLSMLPPRFSDSITGLHQCYDPDVPVLIAYHAGRRHHRHLRHHSLQNRMLRLQAGLHSLRRLRYDGRDARLRAPLQLSGHPQPTGSLGRSCERRSWPRTRGFACARSEPSSPTISSRERRSISCTRRSARWWAASTRMDSRW